MIRFEQKNTDKYAVLFLDQLKERNGGPSTYLYHLKQGLRAQKIKNIVFYTGNQSQTCHFEMLRRKLDGKLAQNTANGFEQLLFEVLFVLYEIESKACERKRLKELRQYPIVQAHHVADLFYLKTAGGYKGKTALMMHTPEPWSEEVIHNLQDKFKTDHKFGIIRMYERMIERNACRMADVFVFPSKEAEETYLKFPFYKKYKKGKEVHYLITGVPLPKERYEKQEVRREYSIPEDAFVILFIGRHNQIKGYDLLVRIQKELERRKVCIVCAGKKSDVYQPYVSPLWFELGWQENVEKLYDMADAVILPNRQTYFDLAAVEALAEGKILLASNTGGNKTLARGTDGVILFRSVKDMIKKMERLQKMSAEERKKLEAANYNYYRLNCSLEQFAGNCGQLFRELNEGNEDGS